MTQRETDIFEMTAHYQREADERLCERLAASVPIYFDGQCISKDAARRIRELWAEIEELRKC